MARITRLSSDSDEERGPIARLLRRPLRRPASRRSPWRVCVPVVCLFAGLMLGATHGVSRGGEIRRSDAPRLVDLVTLPLGP